MTREKIETKRFGMNLTPRQDRLLRQEALEKEINISELIRRILDDYLGAKK